LPSPKKYVAVIKQQPHFLDQKERTRKAILEGVVEGKLKLVEASDHVIICWLPEAVSKGELRELRNPTDGE